MNLTKLGLSFPFSAFEPFLVPIVNVMVEKGFDMYPEGNLKNAAVIVLCTVKSELVEKAKTTETELDDVAVGKVYTEIDSYLQSHECPNLSAEIDKLIVV